MNRMPSQRVAQILVRAAAPSPPGERHPRVAAVEGFFVRQRDRLVWVHGAMFSLFLCVLFVPLALPEPPENATPFSHFTTFASYGLWGLWFPLVFLSVIFTGRSWCGLLCPMGAASESLNQRGLQRPIPRWLRWEGTPVVSFLFITILGQTVGVRDHPEAVAEVFGGTLLAAMLIGFLYGRNKRAWCRHMCPIGLLLGVFSRIGAVQLVPKRKKLCGDHYTEKGVCPTMIDIPRKVESRHCIECFRCVNPKAKGGLYLRARRPGAEIEAIRDHHANPAEVWFMFLGAGAALGGFLWLVLPAYQALRQRVGEWFIERKWFWIGETGPSWLMSVHPERREVFNWLDFFMIVGFMLACMLLLAAVLAVTTALAAWISGCIGGDRSFSQRFVELGYQYTPVAMMSLILGLGGELFETLSYLGLGAYIGTAKGLVFLLGLVWSVYLGERILARQGAAPRRRWLPLLPGTAGSVLVGLAWWPAIFGVQRDAGNILF